MNFSNVIPGQESEEGMETQWHISHDGAVVWVVLLERLVHVVVAHPAVIAETTLLRSAAVCTVRNPGLTRRVAYAASRSVFAGVGTSGETPRAYIYMKGNHERDARRETAIGVTRQGKSTNRKTVRQAARHTQ